MPTRFNSYTPDSYTETDRLSNDFFGGLESIEGELTWATDPTNVNTCQDLEFKSKNGSRHLSDERFLSHADMEAKTELEKELVTRLDGVLGKLWTLKESIDTLAEMRETVSKLENRLNAENLALIERAEKLERENAELKAELDSARRTNKEMDEWPTKAYRRVNATRTAVADLLRWAMRKGRKTVPLDALERAYWAGAHPSELLDS